MGGLFSSFAGFVLSAPIGLALAQSPTLTPTPFEEFASKPSVVEVSTRQIGSIDSSDARATVTVLKLKDTASSDSRMQGVRFDLQNNSATDRVWLDEAQLELLQRDLAQVEAAIPTLKNEGHAHYRVQGTESCWVPDPAFRILCPSYRIGPDWSGFMLAAFGGPAFALPNHLPSELAELIELARTELEAKGSKIEP